MPKIVKTKINAKQARISAITDMLSKGMERRVILQKLTKLYKVSPSTIDKEIKDAKIVVSERNEAAEKIRVSATKQMTEDAIKEGLKSDLELEVILCQIAGGSVRVEEWIKGESVLRSITPMEIIQAVKTLFAKRGSNAAIKTDITSLGEKITWNETKTYDPKS